MYIGESRYFDLAPISGVTLEGYTATWEMVVLNNVVYSGVVNISSDNKKFEVRIDTTGMQPNTYDLRVKATDTIDDYVKVVYREKLQLVR